MSLWKYPQWSEAFWQVAKRVAYDQGFEFGLGSHKDHYTLIKYRAGANKDACLAALEAAGVRLVPWCS